MEQFDLIINATSAGLKGEGLPFPGACVGPHTLCYDLAYSFKQTPFVEWASDQGAGGAIVGMSSISALRSPSGSSSQQPQSGGRRCHLVPL